MSIALIGGLDRLSQKYEVTVKEVVNFKTTKVNIKVFSKNSSNLTKRLADVDVVVLFTSNISHAAARKIYKTARQKSKKLICSHNSSIQALKTCLEPLRKEVQEGKDIFLVK